MKNKETIMLHNIYHNLKDGMVYGYSVVNVKYPYFQEVLSYSEIKNIFCWHHYGSSANKATLSELRWIINVIFKMTPTEFIKQYTLEC